MKVKYRPADSILETNVMRNFTPKEREGVCRTQRTYVAYIKRKIKLFTAKPNPKCKWFVSVLSVVNKSNCYCLPPSTLS